MTTKLKKDNAKSASMMAISTMTKDERSLLLYLESRAVDNGGMVDTRRMNTEDQLLAEYWHQIGLIEWGRIVGGCGRIGGSNWVRLSSKAWELAHEERRCRANRVWQKRDWQTTAEKRGEPSPVY